MEIQEIVNQALEDSIKECFQGVMSITIEGYEKPQVDNNEAQVVSSIGFAGQLEGNMTIIFGEKAACQVVGKMLYSDFTEVNADVLDGVGEIVNMTVGGIKNRLTAQFPLEISIPMTMRGRHIDVFSQKELTRLYKSYRCAEFDLDVLLYFKLHTEKKDLNAHKKGLSAAEKLAAFVDKNK